MPALRNAESDLKPSRNSQLASLLRAFGPLDEDKERITSAFVSANETVKADASLVGLESIINSNLNLIEKEELKQKVSINLLEPTFEAIAGSLDAWFMIEHQKMKLLKIELLSLLESFNIHYEDLIEFIY